MGTADLSKLNISAIVAKSLKCLKKNEEIITKETEKLYHYNNSKVDIKN